MRRLYLVSLAMHHVMFILICLIWGGSFILMKKAALAFGPIGVGAWRVVGGAVVLALFWAIFQRKRWPVRLHDLPPLALVTVLFGYIWPFVMQPYLIHKNEDSAFFGVMVSFVPLMTIIVSVPMLGIWPTRRQVIGVLGGLVFMAMLLGEGALRKISVTDLLLAATVPLSYSISNTYIRRRFKDIPAMALSGTAAAMAAVVLLPTSLIKEGIQVDSNLTLAIASVATLGVLGTGVGPYFFCHLVQHRGPLFAGMTTYIVPLGALMWGKLDSERITLLQIGALVGVLIMVAVVQIGHRPVKEPHAIVLEPDGAAEG